MRWAQGGWLASAVLVAACGYESREHADAGVASRDAGVPGADAASDAGTHAAHDAGTHAAHDTGTDAAHDAGTHAAHDAGTHAAHDAGTDPCAMADAGPPDPEAPAPEAGSFRPDAHHFGSVRAGAASASVSFRLTNLGSCPAGVLTVTLTGPDPAQFEIVSDGCDGVVLGPGESCSVEVRFVPRIPGSMAAALHARPGSGAAVSATMSGVGTSSCEAYLTPAVADFGPAPLGTRTGPQTLTMTNGCDSPLEMWELRFAGEHPGDFVLTGDACAGTVLPPGAGCAISLAFEPAAAGTRRAAIEVLSPPSGRSATTLEGTGVAP